LYDIFQQATHELEDRRKDLAPKDYAKQVQESLADKSILMYLDWVLKQNEEPS